MINLKKILLILISISFTFSSFSQNLMTERIRKVGGKKRSIYFNKGIFYSTSGKVETVLKAVRHSYISKRGYERLVFDFSTKKSPKIYGYLSGDMKKIYIDFFDSQLANDINSFGESKDSKFIDGINFYPVGDESLSTEVILKNNAKIDVFYLNGPGRLVIDIKG